MFQALVRKACSLAMSPLGFVLRNALKKAHRDSLKMDNGLDLVDFVHDRDGRSTTLTIKVPKVLEQDFLAYRSETYFRPMTEGVAHELAQMLLKLNRPEQADTAIIEKMFFSSAGALMTKWNDAEDCFVADFSVLRASVWKGYYQDIAFFKANPKRNFYQIIDTSGRSYAPGQELWQTAVNHLVSAYTIAIPIASHNWVHFCYPELMGAAVFHVLKKESILYRLLFPHTRFTNRINFQALWVQKSTDNTPSFLNHIVPWKCFPIYGDDFRNGVLTNTHLHYKKLDRHFNYPEQMDTRLPYFAFLKGYFEIIERFVNAISSNIEDDEYNKLAVFVDRYLPGFKDIDKARAISILIWQVAVLHGTEHHSYFDLASTYGFSEIRTPISQKHDMSQVSLFNRFKVKCFLNVFVIFNPNSKLDQRLTHYKAYRFDAGSQLEHLAQKFSDELNAYDQAMRTKGEDIVALDKMVQSVCY